jgi:hypothetical protein
MQREQFNKGLIKRLEHTHAEYILVVVVLSIVHALHLYSTTKMIEQNANACLASFMRSICELAVAFRF